MSLDALVHHADLCTLGIRNCSERELSAPRKVIMGRQKEKKKKKKVGLSIVGGKNSRAMKLVLNLS